MISGVVYIFAQEVEAVFSHTFCDRSANCSTLEKAHLSVQSAFYEILPSGVKKFYKL